MNYYGHDKDEIDSLAEVIIDAASAGANPMLVYLALCAAIAQIGDAEQRDHACLLIEQFASRDTDATWDPMRDDDDAWVDTDDMDEELQ